MANERYENNMAHAPMEIFSAVRKNYTFAVEDALALAGTADDANQPVKLHAGYSRFKLAVIQDGKFATANLDVRDFPGIRLRSEEAVRAGLAAASAPEGDSAAYTTKIMVGKLKGKTPAQVMSEMGDAGMSELNNAYKWLKNNFDPTNKYAAGNRAQMDAISETAKLYKAGELKASAAAGGAVTIHESGFRPLMKRTGKNGKNFVYEYAITFTPGNASPVRVEISNYYATVAKKDDGRLNVLPATKEDVMTHTAYLTSDEWLWALHMMEVTLNAFEMQNAPRARQYCLDREKKNMEAARGAAS